MADDKADKLLVDYNNIDNTDYKISVPALRVSQLDANELDVQLESILKQHLYQIFKYHQSSVITSFDPEIGAVIRALLWRFSLYSTGSTIGQQILNLKYKDTTTHQWISSPQKLLYGAVVVICPWLKERVTDLLNVSRLETHRHQIRAIILGIDLITKASIFFNFLVFLRQGHYVSLVERLLGVRAYFPKQQSTRHVSFEFMTRELLWHGFSEILTFLLPLVNFRRLHNIVTRTVTPVTRTRPEERTTADLRECGVCGEWPVCPRQIGCAHVFCYYCIQCNIEADPTYNCPKCGHSTDMTSVCPVTEVIHAT